MKTKLLASLLAVSLAVTTPQVPVAQAQVALPAGVIGNSTTTPLSLNVQIPNGQLAAMYGDLTMESEKETVLQQVRNVRAQGWDKNPKLEFWSLKDYNKHVMTVREAAAFEGLTTRDAYINAISWDEGLEHAVIQRAAEENESMNHLRPDGSQTGVLPGVPLAENLTSAPMRQGVKSFMDGEWNKLLSGNYQDAGHVTSMLNPAFHHFAQAQFANMTAQLFTWEPAGASAPRVHDGHYAVPMTFKDDALAKAQMKTKNVYLDESGQAVTVLPGQFHEAVILGTYESTNPAVLTISQNGAYTGVAEGNSTIRFTPLRLVNGATTNSTQILSDTVTVTQRPAGSTSTSSGDSTSGIILGILAIFGVLAALAPHIMKFLPH